MPYIGEPLSRSQIRAYAKGIRETFHKDKSLWFPIEKFLEALPLLMDDESFYYYCVDDDELPFGIHAEFDANENCIRIKNSVYIGACEGNGRDRMTIAHEIGHALFIRHSHMVLQRCFDDSNIPTCRDPEWHAKCFAGELLVPVDRVAGMSPLAVARECGVSVPAAEYQLKFAAKQKRPSFSA